MSHYSIRIGPLGSAWRSDISTVLERTGKRAAFYGISWRWIALGVWVFR